MIHALGGYEVVVKARHGKELIDMHAEEDGIAIAIGEDRSELLLEHLYAGRIHVHNGRVLGFYLPLLGEGLVVAETEHAGLELLRWHLPGISDVVVPEGNGGLVHFLQERRYVVKERCQRM